jgi:hypothetical protein
MPSMALITFAQWQTYTPKKYKAIPELLGDDIKGRNTKPKMLWRKYLTCFLRNTEIIVAAYLSKFIVSFSYIHLNFPLVLPERKEKIKKHSATIFLWKYKKAIIVIRIF